MDGETEIWRELQPPQSADGETRGALCERTEDRPAHGFSQRILCPPQTAGTNEDVLRISVRRGCDYVYLRIPQWLLKWFWCRPEGLLCGDPVPK